MEKEYGQVSVAEGELGQEATGDAGIGEEANEVIPLRKSVLGKRKSVAQPPKSRARRVFVSPTNKQSKAKPPMPSKTRTTKGKEVGDDCDSDESSWGDPDPEVIERIKILRPIRGAASSEGFGPIPIPGNDKVPSKSKEAKKVEALTLNMKEALANPDVRWKILAREIGEPPLPDDILSFVDSIIDWSDLTSFIAKLVMKAKASEVSLQKPFITKGGVRVSYGISSMEKKPGAAKTQPETSIPKPRPINELPPFYASDFELVLGGFIPNRRTDAITDEKGVEKGKVIEKGKDISFQGSIDMNKPTLEEFELDVGNTTKKPVPDKGKVVADKPSKSSEKRIVDTTEAAQESKDMNEDRDVSMARFDLAPMGGSRVMGRDAIDDVESINFEVGAIRTHLSNLAKAYLGKTKFGMTRNDIVESLDEQIEKQVKHIKEMEKSLDEMKELVAKLEEGLVSAKAYLGSLNQDKERLNASGIAELRKPCIEVVKTFGDEPSHFLP
ncbi:hypothetical protein SLEP1_g9442 [Rubroshorea leprosula]|uniref:Uncharacterized protein n=1 Tax=Rubroshorea leprosula TaxID=152421 RepID=A0AAV5IFX4_9ROSI|nr:hypothetical protein SLEP1_g9442 [Rubroshorea leprosula]